MDANPQKLSTHAASILLFLALVAIYHANLVVTRSTDIRPNLIVAVSLLNHGDASITPDEFPNLFEWAIDAGDGEEPVNIPNWNRWINGVTARERYERGEIRLTGHPYYLIASIRDGEYVSRYGLGSPITALPVFALADVILLDPVDRGLLRMHVGKVAAACCVAGSAVFIFWIALLYLPRTPALIVALTYGLGTSVWSTSSQGLWQHGPTELFLAMGCYFYARGFERSRDAVFCALAVAMAIMCRPTSAALGFALSGAMLVNRDHRRLVEFVSAGMVIGLIPMSFNFIHSGSILGFAQSMEVADYAIIKTGSQATWRFDVLNSATAMLFSPSRGLFVFSPVMMFAVAGLVPAWRQTRFAALRPMSLALALTLLIQFSWFDWWGGWSYGPRLLVDAMVYLGLFLIPVADRLRQGRVLSACFLLALTWSIFVQALGAFAATGWGWNDRIFYQVEVEGRVYEMFDFERVDRLLAGGEATLVGQRTCNVDLPECRDRLWSLRDNQIAYHVKYYRHEREWKMSISSLWRER